MDCHSKKCVKGMCAGRLEGEDCNRNIDCVSGLHCNTDASPGRCEDLIQKEGKVCRQDRDCLPLSCQNGRDRGDGYCSFKRCDIPFGSQEGRCQRKNCGNDG